MGEIATWTLLTHALSTFSMVGIIWFVQIVHYPLFSQVGKDYFCAYELNHQRLTTWVVAPLMLVELFTAVLLIWYNPLEIGLTPLLIGMVLVIAIWLITFIVQVPQHASLVSSYDPIVQRRLVKYNWLRTVAWTARGLLVMWMVSQVI